MRTIATTSQERIQEERAAAATMTKARSKPSMKGPKDNAYEGKGYSTSSKSSKGDDDDYSSSNSSKGDDDDDDEHDYGSSGKGYIENTGKGCTLGIERALVPRGVTNADDTLFISPVLILCRTK